MGANNGLEKKILGKAVLFQTSKVVVAIMLDSRCKEEEESRNSRLQGWLGEVQKTCQWVFHIQGF